MCEDDGDLTKMLGMVESKLAKSGTGFFVGDSPTIADCAFLPVVRQLRSGVCMRACVLARSLSCASSAAAGAFVNYPLHALAPGHVNLSYTVTEATARDGAIVELAGYHYTKQL